MRVKFKENKTAQEHMIHMLQVCARARACAPVAQTTQFHQRFPYLQADAEEYNTMTAEGSIITC
jgi:hypothetical protein